MQIRRIDNLYDLPTTPRLVEGYREHFKRYRCATYEGERRLWVFHHELTRRGTSQE